MSTYKNLMTVCAVAALALGLAACGGGGSSTPTAAAPEPTPKETCEAGGGIYADGNCTTAAELKTAADDAVADAKAAVDAVMDDSEQSVVDDADDAITAAEAAVMASAGYDRSALDVLIGRLAERKMSRTAAMDAADDAAASAMRIAAGRLRLGMSARVPSADLTSAGTATATGTPGTRDAGYANNDIVVSIEDDALVTLSEDKSAMIADNHGWKGKRYADPAGGDSYEAVVYSNVEAPKMGRKFGSDAAVTATGAYEYMLNAQGMLESSSFEAKNVAFTGVTRTAGTETFKLPSPNPTGADIIVIPGSYHGVSGTYSCTPSTPADGCSAAVAAKGFTVSGGDTWTFKPSNAEARVRDAADTAYSSYGWWLKKTADGRTWTSSAFDTFKGTDPAIGSMNTLNGTATYMGGAAGKYALFSLTGGTNDAGHFTARARLEADFTNNEDDDAISGTIDQFIGADGESRNWTVHLLPSTIGDTGVIGDATNGTRWIIDGVRLRDPVGQWSGSLREAGTDGVPQVATGTWYTWYANTGRMVGAFGANKQD